MKNKKVKKVAQDCLSGSGVPLPGAWNQVPQPQGASTCPLNINTFLAVQDSSIGDIVSQSVTN